MAKKRYNHIIYELKKNLWSFYAFGESKKAKKDETDIVRAKMKAQYQKEGLSKKEAYDKSMEFCAYREKMYSESTYKSYIKSFKVHRKFCKEFFGTDRISMETCIEHIQDYLDWLSVKGYAPTTIKQYKSAICKGTKQPIHNYKTPTVHYSDAKRSRKKAKNDSYNERRAARALGANDTIGIRRAELGRVKVKDIHFIAEDYAIVYSKGKGGKHNEFRYEYKDQVDTLHALVDEAIAKNRDYILTKAEMINDADLHSKKATHIKDLYRRIEADIEKYPEKRESYYKEEVIAYYKRHGLPIPTNWDNSIRCRGYNRRHLLEMGKPVEFDRVITLYISCFAGAHFASTSTVEHYLTA